jgi:hypothetical protein
LAAFAASRRAPVPLFDCAAYEFIRTRYNAEPQSLPSGQYNLGGTEFPFTPNTGHPFASFLLGSVSSAVFTQNMAAWLPRWSSHAWYVQTASAIARRASGRQLRKTTMK